MVQPLSGAVAARRPDMPLPAPPRRQITVGNPEGFLALLRKLSVHANAARDPAGNPESAPAAKPSNRPEISFQPEPPGCLAPDEQSSLGGGGRDVAELFALINPMGGSDAAMAVVPVPPTPRSGVAEVVELVERWVRRVALGGDQRRAAVRLDIGQGRFSGAEVLVVAEAGHVSVELQLPSSMSGGDLSERLRARLERRGYVAEVSVR